MPKESTSAETPDNFVEILHDVLKHMDARFDQADIRVDKRFDEVLTRLDRIEFLGSGQERRISIIEDRIRVMATKLGLEFRQTI